MQDPELEWRGAAPYSRRFGDMYFNPEDGAGESRHVFLEGNDLPARLAAPGPGVLQIGEIGFGTGLNFLVTLNEVRRLRSARRLVYVSCEGFPLARVDLERALRAFPALATEAAELLAHYPPAVPGVHRIVLDEGRVVLQLHWGAALDGLRSMSAAFCDAWYLDGFAPARNPGLWTAEIIAEVARLSRPGATASSFSVAGAVRRGLTAVGFTVAKAPGFGRKREMLRARYADAAGATKLRRTGPPVAAAKEDDRVVVIGGGLAGTALVEALSRRGIRTILIEREAEPARGASGNEAGLAFPWLSAEPTPLSRLSLIAFTYLRVHLARMQVAGPELGLQTCGVLQLFYDPAIERRLRRGLVAHDLPANFARAVDPDEAARLVGLQVAGGGLYYPDGLLVSPRALCFAQLAAARATGSCEVVYHRAALTIEREGEAWLCRDEAGEPIAAGTRLVLCAAADTARFVPLEWLPLRRVRGQVLRAPAQAALAVRTALCYDGYVTPAVASGPEGAAEHWVGATFEEWNHEPQLLPEQNLWLFDKAARRLPGLDREDAGSTAGGPRYWPGRVAFRSAARDRFPVIGPIPDRAAFLNAGATTTPAEFDMPGLFVSTAHGSRGLLTAPLGAEILGAMMSGEASPVPGDLLAALDPSRFLRRERRKRHDEGK